MQINGREISSRQPPYIIAELSANHNGEIETAKKTILSAKMCGADAVKIQTYTPDTMTIQSENDDFKISSGLWSGLSLYELYSEAYTPYEWHEELFRYAHEIGITLFSSPFDETAVDLLSRLNAPAYKIASFELVDLPLISYVAKQKKPMILSTGMASLDEIGLAIETVKSGGVEDLVVLHCTSSYPAPLIDANIYGLKALAKEFGCDVGLSDHTVTNTAAIVATALGAVLVEKHFILDRSMGGVDSSFSLEPPELKQLVQSTRAAHEALGKPGQMRSNAEYANLVFRRSIYFVQDVERGEIITREHVRRIRPGYGLSPQYFDQVIGSVALKSAKRGDRLTVDHVDLEV